MPHEDRLLIKQLAIPFKHVLQGNENVILENIAMRFPSLEKFVLLAGAGFEDREIVQNEEEWKRIVKWHDSMWKEVNNKKRKYKPNDRGVIKKQTTFPTIEKQFIEAHVAHYYEIDDFMWSSSSRNVLSTAGAVPLAYVR